MGLDYLVTSLIVVIAPGTGVLYTLAMGLTWGRRTSAWAALGCTLGIVPHLLAAVFGLAAVLHASAVAFQVVKIAGVLFLLYMAWTMLRERGAIAVDAAAEDRETGGGDRIGAGRVVARGILINILNPKLSLFFLAFLPQFLHPGTADPIVEMLVLGAVFMGLTLVVFLGYGMAAAAASRAVMARPVVVAWMRRTFAAAFVALGARLALEQR